MLGAWHHRAGKQFAHRHPKHEGRIIPAAETLIAGRLALLTSLRSVSMPVSSNSISIPRSHTASSIARCPRPAGKSACCPRSGCERYDAPGNAGNAPHSAAPCDGDPRCDRSWPSRSYAGFQMQMRRRCLAVPPYSAGSASAYMRQWLDYFGWTRSRKLSCC